MKTQNIKFLGGLMLCLLVLSSFTAIKTNTNDPLVITAVFDGKEDYGYNFIAHEDDEDYMVTFQEVKDDVLKAFDLKSEKLIGTKFKITYTTKIIVTKDEDGYEDEEELNTITKLEKL